MPSLTSSHFGWHSVRRFQTILRQFVVTTITAISEPWEGTVNAFINLRRQDSPLSAHKFLILNRDRISQAGRRGFDPRLPLHVFNSLGVSHGPRFSSLSSLTVLAPDSPRGAR